MTLHKELQRNGIKYVDNGKFLTVFHNDLKITYWKKSQWFSGKGVTDGNGIKNLVGQLKAMGQKNYQDAFINNPEAYNHIIGVFQKHLQFKISEDKIELIKSNLKSKFIIELKRGK